MDLDDARDFLRTRHRAVLATLDRTGAPALTPVLAGVAADGAVIISSRQTAYKVKNLRRDPRAWLCVLPDAFFGQWLRVDGTARIVDLPEAMEGLVDYYRRLSGEHPDWDGYRASMETERRVLIRLEITRAGPDRQG
jgi:PPOX class probable F420-dependent enzyme